MYREDMSSESRLECPKRHHLAIAIPPPLEVDFLRNKPEFVDAVVDGVWAEWPREYETMTPYTTKDRLRRFYGSLGTSTIPVAYVAFRGTEFVGTCLVDVKDMGVRPDCSPWLTGVYVVPDRRSRGEGEAMLRRVLPRHPVLHLWTFDRRTASFYERLGFIRSEIIPEVLDREGVVFMIRRGSGESTTPSIKTSVSSGV